MATKNTTKSNIKKCKTKKARLRWDRLLLLLLPVILIPAALIWTGYRLFHPLLLKSKEYTVEYKAEVFEPYDNVKDLFFDSASHIEVSGSVNSDAIGVYDMTYTYKGKDYPFQVKVADTTPPVLKVQDYTTDAEGTIEVADFIDSSYDATQFTLTLDSRADTRDHGKFPVTITAVDEYGNTTVKKANLIRQKDTAAPVLENFIEERSLLQGTDFEPSEFEVVDNLDPSPHLSIDTSALDIQTPGVYDVTYTVSDRSGNNQAYIQKVTVREDPDYDTPVLYLTFDDGPSENTKPILDILDEYNAKATFFVTGLNPEYFPLMKEIVDRGHTIALHTFTHDYEYIYSSLDNYFTDLQEISDLVEKETGVVPDVIRFPGGSSNMVSSSYTKGIMTELTKLVREKGYQYFDWNADSTDASGINVPAATITANALGSIGQHRVNMLFHDASGKQTTVEALPAILDAYAKEGYVFRGVSSDGFAPHHDVSN